MENGCSFHLIKKLPQSSGHFHYGVEAFTDLVEITTEENVMSQYGGSFHLFIEEGGN